MVSIHLISRDLHQLELALLYMIRRALKARLLHSMMVLVHLGVARAQMVLNGLSVLFLSDDVRSFEEVGILGGGAFK